MAKRIDVTALGTLAVQARRGAKANGARDRLRAALTHRARGEVGTSLDLLAHNLELAALQIDHDEVGAAQSIGEAMRHLAALADAARC